MQNQIHPASEPINSIFVQMQNTSDNFLLDNNNVAYAHADGAAREETILRKYDFENVLAA